MNVFIIDDFSGKGLPKIQLEKIMEDKRIKRTKKCTIATLDAHEFYKKFGFKGISSHAKLMEKIK